MEKRNENRPYDFTISWGTIFKIFAACLIGAAAIRLARFLELVGLAIMLAVALRPVMVWTQRRKWPKWAGVLTCASILFGVTMIALATIIPLAINQASEIVKNIPEYKTNLIEHLPQSGPLKDLSQQMMSASPLSNPEPVVKKVMAWGSSGLEIMAGFFAVLVLTVYFVADGPRAYKWVTAFLPRKKREQLNHSTGEITSVVSHYVAGSALTSLICAIYAFTVLSILKVPNAALLALIAGVFDVLPIIGFFLFTFPAIAVALTVSVKVAILVFVLFGSYHLTEAYFIVPRVYGNRLKLSGLAVLLCCLSAGLVGGVVAIILSLPLAACYPIVERIWLKPYLEPDTARRHHQLEVAERAETKNN